MLLVQPCALRSENLQAALRADLKQAINALKTIRNKLQAALDADKERRLQHILRTLAIGVFQQGPNLGVIK